MENMLETQQHQQHQQQPTFENLSQIDENQKQDNRKKGTSLTRNQEAVTTLLASFGEDVEACSDNFIKQDITYKDLSALTKDDLILLGITNPDKQEEIMQTFRELPKQNPTYEDIVNSVEAMAYNSQILERAASHLDTIKTAISATDLKMKLQPSGDVVIEDRNFASKFVLEAIDELKKITEEIEDRLNLLEEMCEEKSAKNGSRFLEAILLVGVACTSFAVWYYKTH